MDCDSFSQSSNEQSPVIQPSFNLNQHSNKQTHKLSTNVIQSVPSTSYVTEQQQLDEINESNDTCKEMDKQQIIQKIAQQKIAQQNQSQQELIEKLRVLQAQKLKLQQKLEQSKKDSKQRKMEYQDQIKNIYDDNVEIDQDGQYDFDDQMDDIRYLVKDNDTGAKFNIKKIDQNQGLYDQIDQNDNQQKEWQDYWDKVKTLNGRFIDCIETGKQRRLKRILANQIYPIQIDRQIIDGQTGLHIACNDNNLEIVKVLLENHANVNILNRQGQNGLHLVARRGNVEIAKLLIINQINMNQQDNDKNTALHICSQYNHKDMVELLSYQDNVELELRNNKGLKPIDLATNQKIINIYCKKGLVLSSWVLKERKLDQASKKGKKHGNGNGDNKHYQVQFQDSERNVFQKVKQVFYGLIGKDSSRNDGELSMDDFIFYKKLGQGSFGEVFLVRCKRDNQLYAMKILQKQKVVQNNQIRYAMTEKNVLQIMKHPLIVNLNYAFQTKNKLIMVMDYCPKGDLAKLLKNYERIPEKYARIYIAEILLALEALHQESIVFRDLKPENVVLDENGHAMLTDFGLSKQGVKDNISRSFCGSLAYLAPEMLYRVGHSRMVDWYLLGVLMYELIIGITPYFSNNKRQLFDNIKSGPLMIPKTVSQKAKDLIKSLLCRNPAKRLGVDHDGQEIKRHPFFEGIDWTKIYNKEYEVLPVDYIRDDQKLCVNRYLQKINKDQKDQNKIDNWTFIQQSNQ